MTPVYYAVMRSHDAIVKLLLGSEADAGSSADYGRTSLLTAEEHGNEAIIRLLLEHGALR